MVLDLGTARISPNSAECLASNSRSCLASARLYGSVLAPDPKGLSVCTISVPVSYTHLDVYKRQVAEGKNKMLILNAVRNNIIHRIYAVVKRGEKYDKFYSPSIV